MAISSNLSFFVFLLFYFLFLLSQDAYEEALVNVLLSILNIITNLDPVLMIEVDQAILVVEG